jgi:peptide/nickel transport system ATP-binding protein
MSRILAEIQGLAVDYPTRDGVLHALRGVTLDVAAGEIVGLVGESGCGKTTLAYALLGDLGKNARTRGAVQLEGRDLLTMSEAELMAVRGRKLAMVPQNPGEALNPARRIGVQLREVLAVHKGLRGAPALSRIAALLDKVRLPDPIGIMRRWPHELSGGQQQRLVIAMALLAEPALLVLDEPTTGLDVTVEAAVLDLLADLRDDFGVAIVLISHNLRAIARACDKVVVMYAGSVAEIGPSGDVFSRPRHPYTQALLDCAPRVDRPRAAQPPTPIPGVLPSPFEALAGCAFVNRCAHAARACYDGKPSLLPVAPGHGVACMRWAEIRSGAQAAHGAPARPGMPAGGAKALQVDGLSISYKVGRARGGDGYLKAVDAVSFDLAPGRVTAVVGESGSGKSTLAGAIAGLRPADEGSVHLDGRLVAPRLGRREGWARQFLQMIFQDHGSTLNPELRAGLGVDRAVRLLGGIRQGGSRKRTVELLQQVGLDAKVALRRPSQLSGGQRQRVAIARAFAGRPGVVICDEITSALDVSIQAQVIVFLQQLQQANGTSLLFITHDLGVVRQIADEIIVMYLGTICERGPADAVFGGPNHPYTRGLLHSAAADKHSRAPASTVVGSPGQWRAMTGCPFQARCPRRIDTLCDAVPPPWRQLGDGHMVRCHLDVEALEGRTDDVGVDVNVLLSAGEGGAPCVAPSHYRSAFRTCWRSN